MQRKILIQDLNPRFVINNIIKNLKNFVVESKSPSFQPDNLIEISEQQIKFQQSKAARFFIDEFLKQVDQQGGMAEIKEENLIQIFIGVVNRADFHPQINKEGDVAKFINQFFSLSPKYWKALNPFIRNKLTLDFTWTKQFLPEPEVKQSVQPVEQKKPVLSELKNPGIDVAKKLDDLFPVPTDEISPEIEAKRASKKAKVKKYLSIDEAGKEKLIEILGKTIQPPEKKNLYRNELSVKSLQEFFETTLEAFSPAQISRIADLLLKEYELNLDALKIAMVALMESHPEFQPAILRMVMAHIVHPDDYPLFKFDSFMEFYWEAVPQMDPQHYPEIIELISKKCQENKDSFSLNSLFNIRMVPKTEFGLAKTIVSQCVQFLDEMMAKAKKESLSNSITDTFPIFFTGIMNGISREPQTDEEKDWQKKLCKQVIPHFIFWWDIMTFSRELDLDDLYHVIPIINKFLLFLPQDDKFEFFRKALPGCAMAELYLEGIRSFAQVRYPRIYEDIFAGLSFSEQDYLHIATRDIYRSQLAQTHMLFPPGVEKIVVDCLIDDKLEEEAQRRALT